MFQLWPSSNPATSGVRASPGGVNQRQIPTGSTVIGESPGQSPQPPESVHEDPSQDRASSPTETGQESDQLSQPSPVIPETNVVQSKSAKPKARKEPKKQPRWQNRRHATDKARREDMFGPKLKLMKRSNAQTNRIPGCILHVVCSAKTKIVLCRKSSIINARPR